MKISAFTYIPFPRSLVYVTYRDKLLEIVRSTPKLDQVEIISSCRSEKEGQVHDINEWRGSSEIPAIARPFLDEAMLSWTDHAVWNNAAFTTDWRIKTHAFTDAVDCVGRNCFLETKDGTSIESSGNLSIDPKKLKGVPSFLATILASVLEDYLSSKIEPNLIQISQGVQRYLENVPVSVED